MEVYLKEIGTREILNGKIWEKNQESVCLCRYSQLTK
jgi:hypothetical protein